MKCPSCNHVCSDLRDVCPKCYIDLREYKKERGLTVSFPEKDYDELLEKLQQTSASASGLAEASSIPPSPLSTFLKGFLASTFNPEPSESSSSIEELSRSAKSKLKITLERKFPKIPDTEEVVTDISISPEPEEDTVTPEVEPEALSAKDEDTEEVAAQSEQPLSVELVDEAEVKTVEAPEPLAPIDARSFEKGEEEGEKPISLAELALAKKKASETEEIVAEAPVPTEEIEIEVELEATTPLEEEVQEAFLDIEPDTDSQQEHHTEGLSAEELLAQLMQEEEDRITSEDEVSETSETPELAAKDTSHEEAETDSQPEDTLQAVTPATEPITAEDIVEEVIDELFEDQTFEDDSFEDDAFSFTEDDESDLSQTREVSTELPEINHTAVRSLFDECETNLVDSYIEEMSVAIVPDFDATAKEEMALLFDLAVQGFEDPSSLERYVDEVPATKEVSLKSASLAKEVTNYEKALKAVATLASQGKSGIRRVTTPHIEIEDTIVRRIARPSASKRLWIGLLDLGCSAAISGGLCYLYMMGFLPEQAEIALSPERWNQINLPGLLATFIPFLVAGIYFIPGIIFALFKASLGTRLTGTALVSTQRKDPSSISCLIRSFLFPLSAMSLIGLVPAMLKRAPLHDSLSGTEITKIPKPGIEDSI